LLSLHLFSVFSVTASAGNEWMVQEQEEEEEEEEAIQLGSGRMNGEMQWRIADVTPLGLQDQGIKS
jgi:hypothetical protein